MEDKCLICHGTELDNLVKVNVCCGVQIVHTTCLHNYLTQNKTCFICHKDVSDRLIIDTKYRCNYSFAYGFILVAFIIGTLIANADVMHNLRDYSNYSAYKFGLSMFIIGHVAMFLFWLFGGLFLCPSTLETDDIQRVAAANTYSIFKINDKYYLWCNCDLQNDTDPLPMPCRLTRSVKSSVFMAKFITGYSMGLCNTLANLILIAVHYNNSNIITGLWVFGGIISLGLSVPLVYFVVYPFIYCCFEPCYKKQQVHTIKHEYITAYQRESIQSEEKHSDDDAVVYSVGDMLP